MKEGIRSRRMEISKQKRQARKINGTKGKKDKDVRQGEIG
jgi:hypothetical protein